MQVSIKASGVPSQVNASVASQIEAAGRGNPPAAWPVLNTVQSYVGQLVNQAGPEDTVTVDITVDIATTVTAAEKA